MEKKEKKESAAANKDLLKQIYGDASASGGRRPVIPDSDREAKNKHNKGQIRWPKNELQAKIEMLSPPEYKKLKEKGDLQQKKFRKNLKEQPDRLLPQISIGPGITSPSVLPVGEKRVPIRMTLPARKSLPKVPFFSDDDERPSMAKATHQAGEAEQADIEALMPKLRHSDYYTKPHIQELAAKEKAKPGFSSRVKDFVVGRRGFGSIKFFGETDVRRLDLESLVQFNNCKGMVYADESKKPPVGQGLNKPAEVTLLNIKCFNKRTGQQCTKGPRIEKYTEMLKRKVKDQGAEFVSYDPVKGEWKFRVDHFSEYKLGDED